MSLFVYGVYIKFSDLIIDRISSINDYPPDEMSGGYLIFYIMRLIKNLPYPKRAYSTKFIDIFAKHSGLAGLVEYLQINLQMLKGVQYQVDRACSDYLDDLDFKDVMFTDILWPHESIEFYFQDPKYPTFLMANSTPAKIKEAIGRDLFKKKEGYDPDKPVLLCTYGIYHPDGRQGFCNVLLNEEIWNRVVYEKENIVHGYEEGEKSGLTDEENEMISNMIQLCMKILAYSQIPEHKPNPVFRKGMTYGGKPKVNNRPRNPSYRFIYLPKVIRDNDKSDGEPTGRKVKPHTRSGYIKYFRSDRYKNCKGQFRIVDSYDVHGGSDEKKLYKVVKR